MHIAYGLDGNKYGHINFLSNEHIAHRVNENTNSNYFYCLWSEWDRGRTNKPDIGHGVNDNTFFKVLDCVRVFTYKSLKYNVPYHTLP
jgi:hypothetical protein